MSAEIDDLEHRILSLASRINKATYELLVLIREFEERGGFLKWGQENTAEWLAWRCDYSMTTALEKVRVARALKTLPLVCKEFAVGKLSYSKVRALTRVADRQNEDLLVAFALRHSASVVAERCRELRFGSGESLSIAQRALANRSLRVRRDSERGTMTISIEVPLEKGELFEKALDKARDDECLKAPDLQDTSWSTRQADAFMTMVSEYLSGEQSEGSSSDNHLVTIHVDQSALANGQGRSSLPIETVKRLCCDSSVVVMTETSEGEPLSIGRKTRTVPTGIARAVKARDHHCCTFPGCRNKRFVDLHHVEHWSNGGETSADNLILLCEKHHTLVHEGGYRIDKDFMDRWIFVRPDGVAIPDNGYRIPEVCPEGYPPAGESLQVPVNRANEPPPPLYLH